MKRKFTAWIILTAFVLNMVSPTAGFCQNINNLSADVINSNGRTHGSAPTLNLLPVSQSVSHASLKGIKVNPDNPFDLEFIIDTNNDKTVNKEEAQVLVNYFFAGLTLPEKDLWVNLSPYEENRIIPDTTVTTQLGEGLLSQDYLLKQLAASLTYPETELGKQYWDAVSGVRHQKCQAPKVSDTAFNKVWITPDTAKVYENGNSAFITESTLKVLTEEDYLAMQNNGRFDTSRSLSAKRIETNGTLSDHSINAFKQYILPQITQQVNQGEHFSQLRQIYNALILGVWFKNKLKDSIYKNYISQSKTKGIDSADINAKEKIYQQYLNAFKQGAYNYVKKESVGANNHSPVMMGTKITKRTYFSGGVELGGVAGVYTATANPPQGHVRAMLARAKVAIYNTKLSASRAIIGYSANLSVEEYIDKAALDGIIGLHDRVVKNGASMRRDIEVYETGIVIHFDDAQDVNIVFSFEKPLFDVAQAFRGKFKNDFGWNRNFDAGDVARSLLSMLSSSKKYDMDVPKMVDEIVSFLYQRRQTERGGSGGGSAPPGKVGLSKGMTGQDQAVPVLEYLPQARSAQLSRPSGVRTVVLSEEKTNPPPPLSTATKTKLGALGISSTKVIDGFLMPKGVVELLGELFGAKKRMSPAANQGDPGIAAMQEA